MKKCIKLLVLVILTLPHSVIAETSKRYLVPPTSSTRAYVPTISDEAMERCVKLYNEVKWISEKLNSTVVDNYNKSSVDSYNEMVSQHKDKQNKFNTQCAGKRSHSACKVTQELNKEKGLPYQKCIVDL